MSLPPETGPNESAGTLPDVSLGSLGSSSFRSLPRPSLNVPSMASLSSAPSSTALSTPSPSQPGLVLFPRRKTDEATTPLALKHTSFLGDEPDGDDAAEARDEPPTPVAPRGKRAQSSIGVAKSGVNLTLREQEKVIDSLKKENFSLKLKVHFLEERLNQLTPEHVETAFKQNINLKIEVQSRGVELKKYKKLLLELEKELQNAQKGAGGSTAREHELEEALAEREREVRELRRRRAVGPEDGALREAEARNAELEDRQAALEEQLENMKAVMEENVDEIDRLKDDLVHKGNESMTSSGGEGRRARLERKLAEVEEENEDLRVQHEEDMLLIGQREEEKEAVEDELERMKLEIEDLERRREAETMERSDSRAQVFEEREEREAIEKDLNAARDQLAATTIELQQREDELEQKCREIDDLLEDHKRQIDAVDNGWRGEVEEERARNEGLLDVIASRDAESSELRVRVEEYEETHRLTHDKFEVALENRDSEIEAANIEIERLGQRVWELEDEGERLKDDNDRVREEATVDREALESVTAALKERLASAKAQLQEMTSLYEQVRQEVLAHRDRQEELARHAEDLAAEAQAEHDAREQLENELDTRERHREDDDQRHQRALEEKEAELRSALDNLSRQKALTSERDADLAALQAALKNLETETRRAGESHTNDKFSLELELDRLRRDLTRMEDDLSRARAELGDRETKGRDQEGQLDRLHATNRDLTAELATQTQARLNATEKLDITQTSLKAAEAELTTLRARMNELEQRLSKDQRSLLSNEQQFRDQLTERNTLLLTIYQYMDKILGLDKSPRKSGSETKPYTNFSVFHDSLISRLKSLSQIELNFDKRVKEVDARYSDKQAAMQKQIDKYFKQVDVFEKTVKTAMETKHTWRRKYMMKEGELEALKRSNIELNSHLSIIKTAPSAKDSEIKSLTTRALNAERRFTNSQNQLAAEEEKSNFYQNKLTIAERKWDARVKEYEARIKAGDERVKRERQGGKERAGELENHNKVLQKQLEQTKRHSARLSDIVENNKVASAER